MIALPSGVRVWLVVGRTDMRRGMNGLALQVQQALGRDPYAGDLYVFRGAASSLIKIVWHDGIGMSLYAKRLEKGKFVWPSPADGVVAISAAQLAYMLDGIDWRNPRHTWRPQAAGCPCGRLTREPRSMGTARSRCDSIRAVEPLPTDLAEAHSLILKQRKELAAAAARAAGAEAIIAHLKLMIAKYRREQHGPSSERSRRILDQLEFQLEDAEANAAEEALAAKPDAEDTAVRSFTRQKPVRAPLPAHLPRERVVIPAPCSCPACGGKLAKLGEDITETLEVVPRSWKVIQTVREKFTCRACEKITQPPAPFHPIARGRAGASLLAMILCAKFGSHQPLNRQSEGFAREGIEIDVSTLADWVGAASATLAPLVELIRRHVLAAERIHGDDTTVPVLAKGKTATGRLWTYVRDDRPFGGKDPPAAIYFYSRDRAGEHPQRHLASYAGILQADAYGGYGDLYAAGRSPGPITEAACWAHGRRKLFELADIAKAAQARSRGKHAEWSPMAVEAVRQIDTIFEAERTLNGLPAAERLAQRKAQIAPLVTELEAWMRAERARLSRHADVARAIDYMLKRWTAFTRFLEDGRICLSNNAAERSLRGVAVGRRNWTFCGSDRGGERAAAIYTLIETAKLNGIDPEAWLRDVLRRINDHPASRLDELLPWNWRERAYAAAA